LPLPSGSRFWLSLMGHSRAKHICASMPGGPFGISGERWNLLAMPAHRPAVQRGMHIMNNCRDGDRLTSADLRDLSCQHFKSAANGIPTTLQDPRRSATTT
jgi:hypothetical protein